MYRTLFGNSHVLSKQVLVQGVELESMKEMVANSKGIISVPFRRIAVTYLHSDRGEVVLPVILAAYENARQHQAI